MKRIISYLIALALFGCKYDGTKGYVVGKEYTPEHTEKNIRLIGKVLHAKEEIVPSQWWVWVADSCGVKVVNVDSLSFQRVRHGEFRVFK